MVNGDHGDHDDYNDCDSLLVQEQPWWLQEQQQGKGLVFPPERQQCHDEDDRDMGYNGDGGDDDWKKYDDHQDNDHNHDHTNIFSSPAVR